jgi:hypothetical protein
MPDPGDGPLTQSGGDGPPPPCDVALCPRPASYTVRLAAPPNAVARVCAEHRPFARWMAFLERACRLYPAAMLRLSPPIRPDPARCNRGPV